MQAARSGDRSRARSCPPFPLAVRLHRNPRAPGDLLADPEGGQGREPRSQDPARTRGPRGLSHRGRYPRALPVPVRRQGCFDRTGGAFGRRLRGDGRGRPNRDGRAKDPRESRLLAFGRNARFPDAAAFGDASGCRGRRRTLSALFKLEHVSVAIQVHPDPVQVSGW